MKKLLSILLAAVMLFSMFSVTTVATLAANGDTPVIAEETVENGFFDSFLDFFSSIISSFLDLFTFKKELPDVSEWTDEEIIDYYKKAASKSAWLLTGERTLDTDLFDGSASADNAYSQFLQNYVQAFTPTRIRGVMGDYRKLTVDDCKSAKAYVDGDFVVLEILFKEEIDSMHDEKDVVTARHGMKLLENSDAQWQNIRLMELYGTVVDLSEGDYLMKYKDAKAIVKINKSGFVEEGKWTFKASMTFDNVKITAMPENVSFVMDGVVHHYDSTIVVK